MDVADVRRRTKQQHVVDLANDIRERGEEPIQAPTVRAADKKLLCGRDRMAALMLMKARKLWVHVVECTDDEAAELELSENVYRRTENRSELLARLVALKEQKIRADATQGGTPVPPAQRVKAEARKDVAKAAFVTTAAVKKAEQRARDSAAGHPPGLPSEPAAAAVEPALFTPCIDLLGLPVNGATRVANDWSAGVQAAIDEADKYLRLAQAALKKLEACAFHNTTAQQLRDDVHRVASRVRSVRPHSICPWCKHVPKATESCNPCHTLGYVSEEVAARAPAVCLDKARPVVMWRGQPVPYADAVAGRWPKNGSNGKGGSISVDLPDGTAADLTTEYDEAP